MRNISYFHLNFSNILGETKKTRKKNSRKRRQLTQQPYRFRARLLVESSIWAGKKTQETRKGNDQRCIRSWLVVSTHLKNISQIGPFLEVRVKIKNIRNHHLESHLTYLSFSGKKQTLEVLRGRFKNNKLQSNKDQTKLIVNETFPLLCLLQLMDLGFGPGHDGRP